MRIFVRGLRLVLLPLLALGFPPAVWAVDSIVLNLGHIQGAGWQAASAQLQINVAGGSADLRLTNLSLPAPVGRMRELRVRCSSLVMNDQAIDCAQARFHLNSPWLKSPDFQGSFHFNKTNGDLRFAAKKIALSGGNVDLQGNYASQGWQLSVKAQALQLASMLKNAGMTMKLPADLSVDGSADLQLGMKGGGERPFTADVNLALKSMTLGANDGKLASDKLTLMLKGQAGQLADGWSFSAALQAPSGQAYIEPVFLDFAPAPLKATLQGRWTAPAHRLALDSFHIDHADTLSADGELAMTFVDSKRVESLRLQVNHAQLPGAYTRYLQPFLIGTAFDSLETGGRVTGAVEMLDNSPQKIALKLDALQLDDTKRRFALYGANGVINWSADSQANTTSELKWEGGSGYQVSLGAATIKLRTAGKHLALQEPTRIPILDGGLQIKRLELDNLGQADLRVAFDGQLEPMDMEGLCRALGWPVFSGKLAGTVPTLEYRDGSFTVGGTLKAQVFDGVVAVDNLRMEQPFGLLPKLSADMTMRNLDLQSATSAFSFGRIEGRLDGDVKGLRLLKWRPIAFDGRLYTTPKDKSDHRISQRAIENIANLGGNGAAGLLSRGFLRFFKDFAYDRLALGCRLQDGVCQMSGLEPAKSKQAGGYYIVKGRLVPRIDVIGFATEVNWDAFVEQLKGITKSEGPVIK